MSAHIDPNASIGSKFRAVHETVKRNTSTPAQLVEAVSAQRPDRFLRIPEVCHMTGYSRASLYRLERKDEFPRRVKLGAAATAWRLSDVQAWMASRVEAAP